MYNYRSGTLLHRQKLELNASQSLRIIRLKNNKIISLCPRLICIIVQNLNPTPSVTSFADRLQSVLLLRFNIERVRFSDNSYVWGVWEFDCSSFSFLQWVLRCVFTLSHFSTSLKIKTILNLIGSSSLNIGVAKIKYSKYYSTTLHDI